MTNKKVEKNIKILKEFAGDNWKIWKGLGVFAVYLIVSSLGMFVSLKFFGFKYGNPKMMYPFIFFEIFLTFYLLLIVKRYFSWSEVGFGKIRKKGWLWVAPLFIIIAIGLLKLFSDAAGVDFDSEKVFLLLTVLATTILVGFNEELTFRGIILHSFIERGKIFKGVLLSALGFSLIHSANYFAGLPGPEVLGQLWFTFVFGLSFAVLALKLKNIWPLMLAHFLWDFILFANTILGTQASPALNLIFPYEIIVIFLAIVLWFFWKKKEGVL